MRKTFDYKCLHFNSLSLKSDFSRFTRSFTQPDREFHICFNIINGVVVGERELTIFLDLILGELFLEQQKRNEFFCFPTHMTKL